MADPEEAMDEWEHIESPNGLQVPPPPAARLTTAAVIRENYIPISGSVAVFPPAYHEGLELNESKSSPLPLPPDSPQSPVSSPSEEAAPAPSISPEVGSGQWRGVRGILWRAWGRVWVGVGVWKLVSTAGVLGVVAAAALVFVKVRRRRSQRRVAAVAGENKNRLIHLIQEKDQRINQLLLQIAQMNELILARRQVPVVRVG